MFKDMDDAKSLMIEVIRGMVTTNVEPYEERDKLLLARGIPVKRRVNLKRPAKEETTEEVVKPEVPTNAVNPVKKQHTSPSASSSQPAPSTPTRARPLQVLDRLLPMVLSDSIDVDI